MCIIYVYIYIYISERPGKEDEVVGLELVDLLDGLSASASCQPNRLFMSMFVY